MGTVTLRLPGLSTRADFLTRPAGPAGADCMPGGLPEGGSDLRRERNGSGVRQRRGEPSEDRKVHVQRDPLDLAHPKGQHRPFVLQPTKLPLDPARLR